MTTSSKSFHPPWAVTIWMDDTHIFTEVPCIEGPPYIQKYSNTEGGLSLALNFLRDKRDRAKAAADPKKRFVETKAHPLLKRPKSAFTEEQRAAAKRILKKQGTI